MNQTALWEHSRSCFNIRPVYAWGQWMLENLHPWVGYLIVWAFSELMYRIAPIRRANLEANVLHVLGRLRPGTPAPELKRIARKLAHRNFFNRGTVYADLSVLAGRRTFSSMARFRTRGSIGALRECVAKGRGAVLASAHLGNWHCGAIALGRAGIPVRVVMYRNHASELMDRRAARHGRVGQIFVGADAYGTLEVVRALQRGEVIAMLADNPWDSRSVEAPFFGKPSRFPIGPVRIARLAGVPIFPAFCVWDRPRDYTATLCDPFEVSGPDPERAERDAVARLAGVIEENVASHLSLWFNFTPVWQS